MIYLSNVNGDWWQLTDNQPLFILNTDLLDESEISEIEQEYGGFENDKFENVIEQYATNIVMLDELAEE